MIPFCQTWLSAMETVVTVGGLPFSRTPHLHYLEWACGAISQVFQSEVSKTLLFVDWLLLAGVTVSTVDGDRSGGGTYIIMFEDSR